MKPVWRQTLDQGANAQLIEGVVATSTNLCGHPSGSFSASSTAILGAANSEAMSSLNRTVAKWSLDLNLCAEDKWLHGYLIIACLRHFGGCHTATKNQEVEIFLNDAPFERFRLANIPPTHDDYFYRPPLPNISILNEIIDCQTVYAWPVQWERLQHHQSHSLQIQIGNMVRWDIDYLGFVYEVQPKPEYDIALSFAWEDRAYVEQVADLLLGNGVKVFYDRYFQADLWGKDLYEHLADVYKEKARYTVMFISKHYRDKLWAKHERRAAQARAFTEAQDYILPARFDKTEIPGLLDTIGYIYLNRYNPKQLVELLITKLRSS